MSAQSPVSRKDVQDLFSQAGLTPASTEIVVNNLYASAAALAACQGDNPLSLGSTEGVIVKFVIDKSGSMQEVEVEVPKAILEAVSAMNEAKQSVAITLSVLAFSDDVSVLFANRAVDGITQNDIPFYASGRTALYDAVMDALTGALKYEEEQLNAGMTTKVIVVVFSDGADNASTRADISKIAQLTKDLKKRENWILAFVGFKTYEAGRGTDYMQIARDMGFNALLEIDLSDPDVYKRRHVIRGVFQLVSKSVIRKSQTAIDPKNPAAGFLTT